ncbi:MAG: c-type cytochrome [Phycisphaerales bacterium]|nr:c-type cytochrome [Phycisphaerales bacterium]
MKRFALTGTVLAVLACFLSGCFLLPFLSDLFGPGDDGPIAPGVSGPLGSPMPSLSPEELQTFERGIAVMQKRFDLAEGLGPAFNVVFCGGCHEKPTPGGSAGLYRNFFLGGRMSNGRFVFSESAGDAGGVIRMYDYDPNRYDRPEVPDDATIFAQRSGIPMFGVGLIAELSDEEIRSREDPDDANGDGISGRVNIDRGFVGRFGRKSQTVSIEGFVRGPLFNHVGITTNPLTNQQRSELPVTAETTAKLKAVSRIPVPDELKRGPHMQAAAADGPNFDNDNAPDPEMSGQELFDLISAVMMLAAPEFEEPTEQTNRGRLLFHEANCSDCHTPRLNGPRGPVPAYSDLLLHDMGDELADGIVMGLASGSEFRTQPLWGISTTGPYLHDGRATTIREAVLAHGGEATASRNAFDAFTEAQKDDLIEFLLSLGGRDQFTAGLLPPDAPLPGVGEYGGPFRALTAQEEEQFLRGRAVFDFDFGFVDGAGGLAGPDGVGRFNGDSCRACHFDPVIGGAGPRGVNVMRHCIVDNGGAFSAPPTTPNTILHKEIRIGHGVVQATDDINFFEQRQTPHAFGLGLIDAISEATILSNADPNDNDADGISGRAHVLGDGRIGRLGWKAQVPNTGEFVADAMAAEIGLTLPDAAGLSFALAADQDGVADPELSLRQTEDIIFFLSMLAGPPRRPVADAALVAQGEALFDSVGCTKCHIPSLPGALGDVPLYSDLLLHEILPAGTPGIEDGDAGQREFRTAPLWGLSQTPPYFHDGESDTIDDAIRRHAGEAAAIRDDYVGLSAADRAALLAFMNSL